MAATEVEQLTGQMEGGRGEVAFHSTLRWCVRACVLCVSLIMSVRLLPLVPCCRVEQNPDFKLRVELYHLVSSHNTVRVLCVVACHPWEPISTSSTFSRLPHPLGHWTTPPLGSGGCPAYSAERCPPRPSRHGRGGPPSTEERGCPRKVLQAVRGKVCVHVLLHHQTSVRRTGLHPSLADGGGIMSSRFSLVGHVEVTLDSGEGRLLAWLGPRFQIEFDINFDPEWEEDCAVEGFLVSVSVLPSLTDSTTSSQR